MSLQDAICKMGMTAGIQMESDQALANDIAHHQSALVADFRKKHIKKKLKLPHKNLITPADGVDGELKVRPISAMLELARGTALNADPAVTAFARRWSILRYLGLFDVNDKGRLHLDAGTLQFIGPNQRRVLSEDLGIGFGIVVAKHWCKKRLTAPGNHPPRRIGPITAIDIDTALRNGIVPNLRLTGDRQPDYLLAYSELHTPGVKIYDLLETKGTVNKSTAKKQLGRAVTQLAALTVGGQPMTGIAVSTVSKTNGIITMAVDPEEPPMTWQPMNEILKGWRNADSRRLEGVIELDLSADEFFARATNVDNASLAEFGGQHIVAKSWLPKFDADERGEANGEVIRTTEAGRFVGTEYVIDVPGTSDRVKLYQGVEKHVVDGLKDLDAIAVAEAQRAFAVEHDQEINLSPDSTEDTRVVSAFSSDGSMMEIGLT